MADALDFTHHYEPASSTGAPTLLVLHGTGGDEHDLVPLARVLWPGAAILSPRGKVLERGMPRFFRRLAEGVFDIDDLKARTAELADFVARAAEHYGFDPGRVVGSGFSNGANIAASLLLLRPGTLQHAALFSPMVPLVPDHRPPLSGVGVFISAGKQDPLVAPENTARLATLLQDFGADVTLRWTEGGHTLTPADAAAGTQWLARLGAANQTG
jgi:phospholipase/carboxylesterase/glyoxalase family protein